MSRITTKNYAALAPHSPFKIAFLGLGVMGYPMAGHLAQAGYAVTVYNRNPEKSAQWLQEFAQTHAPRQALTPKNAAENADVIFCCVGNDDDLRAVTREPEGAFAGMLPGAIFVDHTTTSAQVARQLCTQAQQQGVHFIDAPVSGGQAGAENGQLTIMCGGDAAIFSQIQPIMQTYARAVTLMGESGSGQLTKMVNQICIAGLLQGLAEGIAFGQKAGLDLEQVLAVISKGAAQSWQMENRGLSMAKDQFNFGFAVDWMRKDLGLVLDEARRNQASLPITALVDQFYADIQNSGGQRWDTSSLIKRLR